MMDESVCDNLRGQCVVEICGQIVLIRAVQPFDLRSEAARGTFIAKISCSLNQHAGSS